MQRKLASIQIVHDVSPIPGADFIEKIKVLGWTLVAKKGEFQKYDKCIYFEYDSILPDCPTFAFLKSGDKPIRLRTKKMKKVISQGLALPFSSLYDFTDAKIISKLSVGDDVTEIFGVKKYEVPTGQKGASKGYWPFWGPKKTDEIRIQAAPKALEEMKKHPVYISIKLDGSSCTFAHRNGEFEVCSRNWALKDTTDIPDFKDDRWWAMAKKLDAETKLKAMGNYAVQGELVGPGIQKNRLALTELDFFVFNVYDTEEQKYLDYEDMIAFCNKAGFKHVPILHTNYDISNMSQEDFLSMAEGKYEGTKNEREGIVFRPMHEVYSEALDARLSLKAISNRFLLKGGE